MNEIDQLELECRTALSEEVARDDRRRQPLEQLLQRIAAYRTADAVERSALLVAFGDIVGPARRAQAQAMQTLVESLQQET